MRRAAIRFGRLIILVAVVGIGTGRYQAQAHGVAHQATVHARAGQSSAVLIWQGKILPIVTDVFGSIGNLNTALTNHDIDGVATVGDQFASEQQRFELINPVPGTTLGIAKVMDSGLRNLANGAKALVVGLRASDNTASQRAVNQVIQGLKQFQQGVDAIRRASGPLTTTTSGTPGHPAPQPTPIIHGYP